MIYKLLFCILAFLLFTSMTTYANIKPDRALQYQQYNMTSNKFSICGRDQIEAEIFGPYFNEHKKLLCFNAALSFPNTTFENYTFVDADTLKNYLVETKNKFESNAKYINKIVFDFCSLESYKGFMKEINNNEFDNAFKHSVRREHGCFSDTERAECKLNTKNATIFWIKKYNKELSKLKNELKKEMDDKRNPNNDNYIAGNEKKCLQYTQENITELIMNNTRDANKKTVNPSTDLETIDLTGSRETSNKSNQGSEQLTGQTLKIIEEINPKLNSLSTTVSPSDTTTPKISQIGTVISFKTNATDTDVINASLLPATCTGPSCNTTTVNPSTTVKQQISTPTSVETSNFENGTGVDDNKDEAPVSNGSGQNNGAIMTYLSVAGAMVIASQVAF